MIIYEDNHLLVINKYGGIKVQPDKNINILFNLQNNLNNNLYNQIKDYIKRKKEKEGNVYLGIIHRLDLLTSGIIIFGKTSKSSSRLFNSFLKKEVHKVYISLVYGHINKGGICKDYINDTINPVKIISSKEYELQPYNLSQFKFAQLSYQPLYHFNFQNNPCTVLEIKLETGRKHQIRCQLNKLGHSILGDNKYCHNPTFNPHGFIGLHSYEIIFPHPTKKNNVSYYYIIFNFINY